MHLADLQKWFAEQLLNPTQADQHIASSANLSATQRLSIYAEQYWQRLLPFLQKDYPTLLRVFGPADFDQLIAKPYLLAYPSNHWSLPLLGSRLPDWIDQHYHQDDKILIYQASLVDESFTRIRALAPPPRDLSAPLYLQSYVPLVILNADLFAFRKALLQHEPAHWLDAPFPPIDWGQKRYFACGEEITQTEYVLLKSFENGATLYEACRRIDSAPEIANWFKTWTEKSWLWQPSALPQKF